MNVTIINKNNNSNDYFLKIGKHYYPQYQYEVQLLGGVGLKDTFANTLPKKIIQMDVMQKALAKLQALGYMTKHCVKDMRKWQHN